MSRVGTITKLMVDIVKCQTHITYADTTTRLFSSNSMGLAFYGPTGDFEKWSIPLSEENLDYLTQAAIFLDRHFGKPNGSIKVSVAAGKRLIALAIRASVQSLLNEKQHQEYEESADIVHHTWYLESIVEIQPKRATIIELPIKEHLQIFNRFWHLDNCVSREFVVSNGRQRPRCFCRRIKKTMDCINEYISTSNPTDMELPETEVELNVKMMYINDFQKQLNDLLALQDNRNKRQLSKMQMEKQT